MSSDVDHADLVRFLSIERLATFERITSSRGEAISLHQQTLRLGSHLMVVIGVIEVALRNAICEKLKAHYSQPQWLIDPPTGLVWDSNDKGKITLAIRSAQREIYAKMSQADKRSLDNLAFPEGVPSFSGKDGHKQQTNKRQAQISVGIGQIVAQLTLYFWKRLYSKEYANVLWQPLKTIFPNKMLTRANVAEQLERLYQSRNRIAHHEPIFGRRLTETLDAIEFFLSNFDGKDEQGVSHISKLLSEDYERLKMSAAELDTRIASFKVPVES